MRALIYKAKEAVQNNTKLYERIYNTLTYNRDYARQKSQIDQYASKFGGMWTDRDDFEDALSKRNDISKEQLLQLKAWRKNGIVTLSQAISHELIDAYMSEVDAIAARANSQMLITSAALPEPAPYTKERLAETGSARLVDDYIFSSHSRDVLMHPKIMDFLCCVFQQEAMLTQSLRFDYGSEQPIHQDTAFVRMNAPMKLVGVWIALEDIQPGSGELLYLPGSHRWEGFLFSGRFKHYDEARDGPEQLAEWHQWILDEAERRGVKPQSFHAKKGDVLFWHAGLAHGGAPITQQGQTRLSLVGHYCPQGVRPLYHYYKPAQRKIYSENGRRFTTAYYPKTVVKQSLSS